MDLKTINREARKASKERKLGMRKPVCASCGMDDTRCLENHHLAGKKYDDSLVPMCRNCHRKVSDSQYDHPKPLSNEPLPLEAIGHFLLGLADFLELLFEKLYEFGEMLIATAANNAENSNEK